MMIRIDNDVDGGIKAMDFYVQRDDVSLLVEEAKNRTKEQIIDQYINLRKLRGFSQEKVAEMTGIARTNIVRIESKANVPTIEVLTKLAMALDMELEIRFVPKRNEVQEGNGDE